jgi:hypothetical protein
MTKWSAFSLVCVCALFGYAITWGTHCVPALKPVSFLAPFDAIVEPRFDIPPDLRPDPNKEAAKTVAPMNAGLYAVGGLLVFAGVGILRRKSSPTS